MATECESGKYRLKVRQTGNASAGTGPEVSESQPNPPMPGHANRPNESAPVAGMTDETKVSGGALCAGALSEGALSGGALSEEAPEEASPIRGYATGTRGLRPGLRNGPPPTLDLAGAP